MLTPLISANSLPHTPTTTHTYTNIHTNKHTQIYTHLLTWAHIHQHLPTEYRHTHTHKQSTLQTTDFWNTDDQPTVHFYSARIKWNTVTNDGTQRIRHSINISQNVSADQLCSRWQTPSLQGKDFPWGRTESVICSPAEQRSYTRSAHSSIPSNSAMHTLHRPLICMKFYLGNITASHCSNLIQACIQTDRQMKNTKTEK